MNGCFRIVTESGIPPSTKHYRVYYYEKRCKIVDFQSNCCIYLGECRQRKELLRFHGYGIYINDKNLFWGNWKQGRLDGFGIVFLITKEGQYSISYVGFFRRGNLHGFGQLYSCNGEPHYVGEFANGKFHGYGKIYIKGGRMKYDGFFKNGKYEGIGKEYYRHGRLFRFGFFKHGLAHGKIMEYLPNGFLYYNGEMKNNQYCGNGTLITNIARYKGKFRHNNFHGKGLFIYDNRYLYLGQFKENVFHGEGNLFMMEESKKVFGRFMNGYVHGLAKTFYRDKLVYAGRFRFGKYHGKGSLHGICCRFQNGYKIDSDVIDLRSQFIIKHMIETHDFSKMNQISKKDLRLYGKFKNLFLPKRFTKKQLLMRLFTFYKSNFQKLEEDKYDLFGNKIEIPCIGNDNGIYDLSSMNKYFEKNDNNEYIYHKTKFDERTGTFRTIFPLVNNGLPLSSFQIL